jgi:Cu/Ag efflux protein CusF
MNSREMIRLINKMRHQCFALAVTCSMALAPPLGAQSRPATTLKIQFLGQVQTVDLEHRKVTVKHGAIHGYAERGIFDYSVADESILKRLRPGDDIRATVYPKDRTLYDLKIVYRSSGDKKSGK